jgi:hypothetical protein
VLDPDVVAVDEVVEGLARSIAPAMPVRSGSAVVAAAATPSSPSSWPIAFCCVFDPLSSSSTANIRNEIPMIAHAITAVSRISVPIAAYHRQPAC